MPEGFSISKNFPNPFNGSTMLEYGLPSSCLVSLTIYDILGRVALIPMTAFQPPGKYRVAIDGSPLASGIYICRFSAGPFLSSQRMILIK
jgi:hypothetical protein